MCTPKRPLPVPDDDIASYASQRSRFLKDQQEKAPFDPNETVWVVPRLDLTEPRLTKPLPKRKHYARKFIEPLGEEDQHWMPTLADPPLRAFNRMSVGPPMDLVYTSHYATRSEEWSTLRQMLPSYGNVFRLDQPQWGLGNGGPPTPLPSLAGTNMPHINSSMTKFLDDLKKASKNLRLH